MLLTALRAYLPRFHPRLLDTLPGYDARQFRQDAVAGLTVGIVALPLAMAFAIASGLSPQAGLFTAVIAGLIISALGGTRVCIGGPTGAYIVILAGIVAQYGVANLAVATVMAGIMLLLMGAVRLGDVIRFFPMPIITGFTNGIAVIIFLTQLKDFFGLPDAVAGNVWVLVPRFVQHLSALHPPTTLLASSCLALILLWPKRLNRYLPAPFVALVAAALVVRVGGFEVVTIGSKFGGIPQGLPTFTPLVADWHRFGELLSPAFKIAILGAIESLLAAVVADRALRDQHDANQELMAQGLANVVAPLFGGMAATGAVARTATNIQNGGRTPVAGIVHALFVLGVIVIAAPLAAYVPLAALSAILISVAIKMGDWDIRKAWHFPWRDTFILATTFALTVLFDLTVAIEIGLMIAAGFFIQRMAAQTRVHRLVQDDAVLFERHAIWGKTLPPATLLYRVEGALFFGAVDKLKQVVECAEREAARVVIVQLHRTVLMDTSGLLALAELHDRLAAQGRTLVLASVPEPLLRKVRESGLAAQLGEDNLQPDLYAAFARAAVLSAQSAL